MRRTSVFQTLGQVKTILNLVLGFLLLLFLLYAGYEILKSKLAPREVVNIVNTETQTLSAVAWDLGTFEALPGTDSLMAPLYAKQNYQVSYYDKTSSAVQNYLFVKASDKSSRWLLPKGQALILDKQTLAVKGATPDESIVKWLWYAVVKQDTNQDKQLTTEDQQVLAISTATGDSYTELLPNMKQILGTSFRNGETLLVFYRTDTNNFVAEINLPQQRVIETKALAPL